MRYRYYLVWHVNTTTGSVPSNSNGFPYHPNQNKLLSAKWEGGRRESGERREEWRGGSGRESTLLLSHPQFKFPQLSGSEGVGLGDDRDDIHKMVQLLHEFNVQRLQTARRDKDNTSQR